MTGATLALIDDVRPDLPEHGEQLVLDEKTFALFGPLNAVRTQGGDFSLTHLDLNGDAEISQETYEDLGRYLGLMNRASMWWIGDWLVFGEGQYGEAFSQAADATGLAEQTLLNRMYVCRNVPPSHRRPGLAFSVHAEVAKCKTAREQKTWLDRAEKHGWNRDELRARMKATRKDSAPDTGEPAEPVDRERVIEAAQRVWSEKQDYGADWLVSREAMAVLGAALGAED